MQRTPRQTPVAVTRDRGPSWSNFANPSAALPNRRPSNLSDLETRVAAAEKNNQKILDDISELRQELQLTRNKFNSKTR